MTLVVLRSDDGGTMEIARRNSTVELHIPSLLGWERTAMEVAASVYGSWGFHGACRGHQDGRLRGYP